MNSCGMLVLSKDKTKTRRSNNGYSENPDTKKRIRSSADQKDSFDAQVEYYTSYIGENPDWTLADIYAEI